MTEYRRALAHEEADILDFINMVFSQAHRPHDFAALLPKVYAHEGFSRLHSVAVRNERIRGTVAVLPLELQVDQGCALKVGYVGSVSAHPADRGEGHMKELMDMTVRECERQGYDLLALGGQRQRYNYFGFESGGGELKFLITAANVRHSMRDVSKDAVRIREITDENDPVLEGVYRLCCRQAMTCVRSREWFLDIMHSWNGQCYALEDMRSGGALMGYVYAKGDDVCELGLCDERRIREVIRAWMESRQKCWVYVPMHHRVRANFIKSFAEDFAFTDSLMLHVFNWRHTLETLLSFKAGYQPLSSGTFVFEVEGAGRYEICVRDHEVMVTDTQKSPDMCFTPQRAVEFFFSSFTPMMTASPMLKSWLPVPFDILSADAF